jgi:hypothetical protein
MPVPAPAPPPVVPNETSNRTAFLVACQDVTKQSITVCRCTWNVLRRDYSLEEIIVLADGHVEEPLWRATAVCASMLP